MKIRLSCFNPFSYSITPLGLGYKNASHNNAGHDSMIRLFEREESAFYDTLLSMDFLGKRFPLISIPEYIQQIELVENEVFAEELGFIDRGEMNYRSRFPSETERLVGICDSIADSLSGNSMVGFNITSIAMGPTLYISKAIRERDDGVKIVYGGPITDMMAGVLDPINAMHKSINESMRSSGIYGRYADFLAGNVDFLVHGEGEETIVEIANAIDDGGDAEIPGTTAIREGSFKRSRPRRPVDLDGICRPDFDGIDMRTYGYVTFNFSRGCINACTFCDECLFFKGYRVRDPAKVLEELSAGSERYPGKRFLACDSLLNGDPARLKELCRLITESGLRIDWSGYLRLPETDEELVDLLYESGFRRPKFGLETIDDGVYEEVGKRQETGHALRIMDYCRRKGMKVTANFMIGYPGRGMDFELEVMDRVKGIRGHYDYMPLESINVGIRSSVASDPERWGFEIKSTHEFSESDWEYYTLARSYIPGIITYTRNSLSRSEAERIFEEYNRHGLLNKRGLEYGLHKYGLGWLKKYRRYIPFSISNWLKLQYLKEEIII
ncbi:MAG: radical SAM protein [Candidatus Altiarchaeota archaeon]